LKRILKHPIDLLDDDRAIFVGLSLSAVALLWGSRQSFTNLLFWVVLIPWTIPYFSIGLRPTRRNVPITIRNIIVAYTLSGGPFLAGLALSIILYGSTWSPLLFSPMIGSGAGFAAGIAYRLLGRRGSPAPN